MARSTIAADEYLMFRRWLVVCLMAGLQLAGQSAANSEDDSEADESSITVRFAVSSLGNVTVQAYGARPELLDSVPQALNCNWTEHSHTPYQVQGTCRGWLRSRDAGPPALSLAAVTQALHDRGANTVELVVTAPAPIDAPTDWRQPKGELHRPASFWVFMSRNAGELPSDLRVPASARPSLVLPVTLILAVPALIAAAVRRRAHASAEKKMNWIVWMNWSNVGIWLYWISVINPVQLADYVTLALPASNLISIGLGVVFYSVPPIVSMAGCLIAMAPLFSSSGESFKLLLARQTVAQASIQVPLAIVLVGMGAADRSLPAFSMVAAYLVYRGLAWVKWTMSYSEIIPVESGELFERASALARKAGVRIALLGILRTRVPEEANAFATSGDRIILTESLLRGLPPREVNAIIAHELGHHQAGHLRVNYSKILLWVYLLGSGPLLAWLMAKLQLPAWVMALPFAPILYLIAQGMFSQKREFSADARAAEITGDPEGKIAALGRLAKLSRIPVDGRGIMDSILSHPSMEKRVLTLARRHKIEDARALAILSNPDLAYADAAHSDGVATLAQAVRPAPPVPLARPAASDRPVFDLRARASLQEQLRWWHLIGPLFAAFLIGLLFDRSKFFLLHFFHGPVVWLSLLLSVAVILIIELAGYVMLCHRFSTRIRNKLAAKLQPEPEAVFAGIHPGNGVRFTEGIPDWDFGFVTLVGDWLCYRGEKTRFSISRQEVISTGIVKEPFRWVREHRVELIFAGGVFTLNTDFAGPSESNAVRTEAWIQAWISEAETDAPTTESPEPPPALPNLPGMNSSRIAPVWFVIKTVLKIWVALPVLLYTGITSGLGLAFPSFAAPVAILLRALPQILWPVRPVADIPVTQPATRGRDVVFK